MATYLVTGTNRGIGLEYCSQLQARGDQVIAVCRRASPELEALGVRIEAGIELTAEAAIAELVQRLDGLVLAGLAAETLGCRTIFGLSGSAKPWMANQPDPGLDWQPSRHSGELTPPDGATQWPPADPANSRIGAGFARRGHPDDEA